MINAYSFTHLIELLMQGEWNKGQLVEQTGLHQATVGAYVRHMHRKRILRIAEYRRCKRGRLWVAYYTLNPDGLDDVRRPPRTSSAARNAIIRARRKAIRMNQLMAGSVA